MTQRPTLLFVSTRFLFPVDSGGKIRTTQVLRGLKGGKFHVVLASPATPDLLEKHAAEIESVCDDFRWWPEPQRGPLFHYTRMRYLPGPLPIPVRTDRHPGATELVSSLLDDEPSVAVFDFAHAAVLAPGQMDCPSVMFTHNVEAEIFRRHTEVAGNWIEKAIWNNQYRKMQRFENRALNRFDVVVAVADRDRDQFANDYGIDNLYVIPTGVDLEFFGYRDPDRDDRVVFCGSMDWMANQEGVQYFMNDVWPLIAEQVPEAGMTVVGRAAPEAMINEARRRELNWEFTGFVDDVRPFIQGAAVSVIPLRVGGGTRLKAYEAMSMGSPIVSTSIGMEGLPVQPDRHYLRADDPKSFADCVVRCLKDRSMRQAMAKESRQFVEENFSYKVAALSFQHACETAIGVRQGSAP